MRTASSASFRPAFRQARRGAKDSAAMGDDGEAHERVAHFAAVTGARFIRERIEEDPVRWMKRKLKLFGGRSALESVANAESFERGMLFHELSLGLDIDPVLLDLVPSSDAKHIVGSASPITLGTKTKGTPQLFSASICLDMDDGQIQIFHASMSFGRERFCDRLNRRFGTQFGDAAIIVKGFDWSEPLATSLVSGAIGTILEIVAADPHHALGQGLDVEIQQRFST